MIIFKKTKDIIAFLLAKKKQGSPTGFVPTMGALHQGHISLIEASKSEYAITICSIFVNPTQFNDTKDFKHYPHSIENDIYLLEKAGCDILFLPPLEEIYPGGLHNMIHYDLGYVETLLEGKYRPGHFQGVCQVVHRLLNIVQPNSIYLGQKDYQQCMVLKKLIELKGLPVHIIIHPTLREPDGLAMSSRNLRLNENERKQAVRIYETLCLIKKELKPGKLHELKERAIQYLSAGGFTIDYVEISSGNLELIENWDGKTPLIALVAAFINEVRLIDNIFLTN